MKRFIIKESQMDKLLLAASNLRNVASLCNSTNHEVINENTSDIDDLLFEIEHFQEVKTKKRSVRNKSENVTFSSFR